MKRILIINGHQFYPNSKGRLNRTLTEHMKSFLESTLSHEVKLTIIDDGYLIEEEQEKFKWADCVIYQTPIYWFSIPGKLKTYFDQVLKSGVFFESHQHYGQGGLMVNKHYMLSTTWNAPADQFLTHGGFFEGKSVDEALFHLHRLHAFIGMKSLKSFALFNVIKQPNVDQSLNLLTLHLDEVFTE
ncbi:NAD(P)H-dependent oxidoreductase [Amphibacillus jilinensis]|uniref:NAD(P)H-dependent oxidoreductase n=1 Tax=Amphibacillus jilinensis TaxID=1216008 RepID=UPI0002F7130A|nr:NAD(P)H-dependent oxidoreductase [Amphibacillus jilinensis]